jgi:DNA-binding XRE family transcriptional regulator
MVNQATPEAAEYREWRDQFLVDPKRRAIYEREAVIGELWLRMVEARIAAGITQAELAQRLNISEAEVGEIEQNGYATASFTTLYDYVAALGEGFSMQIKLRVPAPENEEISIEVPVPSVG